MQHANRDLPANSEFPFIAKNNQFFLNAWVGQCDFQYSTLFSSI